MEKMDLLGQIEDSFVQTQDGQIYRTVINDIERVLIENALKRSNGNQVAAAGILGLNRNTIRSKIKKLNIRKEQFKV